LNINFDATYSEDEGCGSDGVVVKDFRGKFIASQTKYFLFVANAMMTEAYTLQEGPCLTQHIG
jgi:hypothetical protein